MWRPRVEVPQFTKCCLCIPLRYGLLGISYVRLALIGYASLMITLAVVYEFNYARSHARTRMSYIALPLLVAVATYIDIGFTSAFIVAGHMKHRRGVLIYYYYTIVTTVLYVVGSITGLAMSLRYAYNMIAYVWVYYAQDIVFMVSAGLIQIYLTLLLRSEYKKLSNPTNFRFVNNAEERTATNRRRSDGEAILEEEQEDTESRIGEIGFKTMG